MLESNLDKEIKIEKDEENKNNEENDDEIKEEHNEIYKKIIKNHIMDLLKTIHFKYPSKLPKNVIMNELEYIMSNINFINHSMVRQNIKTRVKTNSKTQSNKIKKPKSCIDSSSRCQARIWDDIFDRKTHKQIKDLDSKYKVSDFNDIPINSFNETYYIGKQCARKKLLNTNYCSQHNKHRPHGNFCELPNKELCFHFIVDGNYL